MKCREHDKRQSTCKCAHDEELGADVYHDGRDKDGRYGDKKAFSYNI